MVVATAAVGIGDVEPIAVAELGNTCYVLTIGDEAFVVDPPRCVDEVLAYAEARGARVVGVLETHVHNDFLSGGLELRRRTGATLFLPAEGGYAFEHRPMREGSVLEIGAARVVALETPGHTPEHLAYALAEDDGAPVAVFTGGSLLVGNAGRSDLLGDDRTEDLERAQYRSLRRLLEQPDDVVVLPTHGPGSFCVGLSAETGPRTSTVARERERNPFARIAAEDAFVASRGHDRLPIPAYYRVTAPRNRIGVGEADVARRSRTLSPDDAAAALERGAIALDVRDRFAFCASHVPRSLNVELDAAFVGRVGSIVRSDAEIVLIVEDGAHVADHVVVPLARIGFDRVLGQLDLGAWSSAGRPTSTLVPATLDEVATRLASDDPPLILDVRMPVEWAQLPLSVPATQLYVGELPERIEELPRDREIWTVCSAGSRAVVAASYLEARGFDVRPVAEGGALEL